MPPEETKENLVLQKTPSIWSSFARALIVFLVGFCIAFIVSRLRTVIDTSSFSISNFFGKAAILILTTSTFLSGVFLWQGFSHTVNRMLHREDSSIIGYAVSFSIVLPVFFVALFFLLIFI